MPACVYTCFSLLMPWWGASAFTACFVECLIHMSQQLNTVTSFGKPLSLCISNLVMLLVVRFVIDVEASVEATVALSPWGVSSVLLICIYSLICIDWFIPSLMMKFNADIYCSAAIAYVFSACSCALTSASTSSHCKESWWVDCSCLYCQWLRFVASVGWPCIYILGELATYRIESINVISTSCLEHLYMNVSGTKREWLPI